MADTNQAQFPIRIAAGAWGMSEESETASRGFKTCVWMSGETIAMLWGSGQLCSLSKWEGWSSRCIPFAEYQNPGEIQFFKELPFGQETSQPQCLFPDTCLSYLGWYLIIMEEFSSCQKQTAFCQAHPWEIPYYAQIRVAWDKSGCREFLWTWCQACKKVIDLLSFLCFAGSFFFLSGGC